MIFQLTILGSNSATFAFGRHHTAQILNINHDYYLIDCGEGTQIRLAEYKVRLHKLKGIFISHLHGDHYLGLVGLLNSMSMQGRKKPLAIFGPKGLDEIISVQMRCSESTLNYELSFYINQPDESCVIFENKQIYVKTIPLSHRIGCTGFLFGEKPKQRNLIKEKLTPNLTPEQLVDLKNSKNIVIEGKVVSYQEFTSEPPACRRYAFCSDTCYDENIIPHIAGIDLLYHEATFTNFHRQRAKDTFHSTAEQAATIAHKAGVKKLLLGHFSSRYRNLEQLLEEAVSVFDNTQLALEGLVFDI